MPYALVRADGALYRTVPKLTAPDLQAEMARAQVTRIVRWEPPAHDPELQTCTPVLPVPPDALAVSFVVADKPEALARAVQRAHAEIDEAAGQARARYITVVHGQSATYLLKERQARAYQAAGYPADATPWPFVLCEARAISGSATPTVLALQQSADGIIAQADAWINLAAQIEQVRRAAKLAASAGADPAAITAAARAACVALGAM